MNDSWMTDSGRALYKQVKSDDRLKTPLVDQKESTMEDALLSAVRSLEGKSVGIVGSCKSSLEEQFLLNRLAKGLKATKFLRGHFGEDDGILLSADRTPNLRGALITGLASSYPKDHLSPLAQALKKDKLEALLVV